MIQRPPISTRTYTLFPTRRSSDLSSGVHHLAILPSYHASNSSRVGVTPGLATMISSGRSSHRSEEHTSELQSLMRISYAVLCLIKKNLHLTSSITLTFQRASQLSIHHLLSI